MGPVRLSAALIVRDEEAFLDGCLQSLAGRVDEIVVVDTGSTDRSRQIAADLGARVFDFSWHGDFSAARNYSVDQARGDWILYIDADERIVEYDAVTMERLYEDPRSICLTVRFRPATGFTRYREYRLFRKRADLRFRGSIHESLVPDLETLRAAGWQVAECPVALDHQGYDGDMRRKHERNLPLLRARLERDPWHVYSWDHLGLTLLGLNDPDGAESAWRHALEIVRAQPSVSDADSMPFLHLTNHLLDSGRPANDLLAEASGLFPDHHALTWLLARQHVAARDYSRAQALFARLAAVDHERLTSARLAYDTSIFGANAQAALGLCAFQLGHFAESAEHYARAEKLEPGNLEFRARHAVAAARARKQAAPPPPE